MEDDDYMPSAEEQVRAVQYWMALDLHQALGYDYDPNSDYQGYPSWADWWANLLAEIREMHYEQDIQLDN